MESKPLRQQITEMRQSLFDEGMLDYNYRLMEQLSDSNNPNFAEEVMTMFFRDSTKLLTTFERALANHPLNFVALDQHLHQLKGSSNSIGARKMWAKINETRVCLKERDMEGVKTALEQLKKEHDKLRGQIQPYFQMLRQAGPLEVAQRPKNANKDFSQ